MEGIGLNVFNFTLSNTAVYTQCRCSYANITTLSTAADNKRHQIKSFQLHSLALLMLWRIIVAYILNEVSSIFLLHMEGIKCIPYSAIYIEYDAL